MASFEDANGDVWTIPVTLGQVRRVAREAGIDVTDPRHFDDIVNSLGSQLELIFHLCSAERLRQDIRRIDQFEALLDSDSVTAATEALFKSLADFSRKLGQAEMARAWEEAVQQIREAKAQLAKNLESMGTAKDQETTTPTRSVETGS